jgi:hypothetical protein
MKNLTLPQPLTKLTKQMVRIPRDFLADLSTVIFKHDVLFLESVCCELNIPFREAKMKVLGAGEECTLELTGELCDGSTQCEFWLLNADVMIYKQCPARQMVSCSGCELHNIYNKIDSDKNLIVKKEAIATLPELEWVYLEHTKQHLLYSAAKNQLYTKDLIAVKGHLWKDKQSGIIYQVYSSPKTIYANKKQRLQKIENANLSKVSSENV